MTLPNLPNNIPHYPVQTVEFKGLNLTPNTKDGEFSDTLGLQSANYPYITQIPERVAVSGYSSPTDIYVWDRDLFVVDGTSLKKNGTTIGTVTAGTKHMAVINTKLVIYPDKKYVDLTDDTMHSLVAKEKYYNSSYTVTHNSVTGNGIGETFAAGDTVDVVATGLTANRIVVQSVEANKLTFVDNAISGTASGRLTIRTSVPELDFICSSNNRIWGVNIEENTVYASALGDPTDWFTYTSEAGAYTVAVGSEGPFTGICNYGGAVLCFKENMLHKILGSYPSEYYMIDAPVYGVQQGSEKSLVVINNILYYKGVYGVYQYGGNQPVSISYNLGRGIFTGAVGGTDGRKYYIDMADPDGVYHLYAYDLVHGLWLKEEDGQMAAIANLDRDVYYVKAGAIKRIGSEVSNSLSWYGEFVETVEGTLNRKGYLKLIFRLDMAAGSTLNVCAKEDRRPYRLLWTQSVTDAVTLLVPIRLGRCDRWQLKIQGIGSVTIRAIGREFVGGSLK